MPRGNAGRLLQGLAWLRLNRCAVLLAGLLAFILVYPLTTGHSPNRLVVNVALLALLLLARWALSPHRRIGLPALLLAGLALALYGAVLAGQRALAPLVPLSFAALELLVTVTLLSYVLDSSRVTADKIFGAIAAYVLLGMLFASVFGMLLLSDPAALRSGIDDDGQFSWFELFYFSMTVLTSTGFGEIVAATDMARGLIVLAQVTGTMYVAFLVARLANLYPSRRGRP